MTPADYQLLAAKEEWELFFQYGKFSTEDAFKKAFLDIKRRIDTRLRPLAEQGHIEAQLFLGTYFPSSLEEEELQDFRSTYFPRALEENKKWLLAAADAQNIKACYAAACHYFSGTAGFENNFQRAAHYLAPVLRSGDVNILIKFKHAFAELLSTEEPPDYLDSEGIELFLADHRKDAERFQKIAEELTKLGVNIREFLDKEYQYEPRILSEAEQTFLSAAIAGDEAVVSTYLAEGGNPFIKGSDDRTALHEAAYRGHENIVILLLNYYREYDFPIDSRESERQDSPLSFACLGKHVNIASLLLHEGADPFITHTRTGRSTVLMRASHSEEISALLNSYTERSRAFSWFSMDNLECVVDVTLCHTGNKKANFLAELTIRTFPFECSSDADPILERVNQYLKLKKVPELAKRYEMGAIQIVLSPLQAFHVLRYMETDAVTKAGIKFSSNLDPTKGMQIMKNLCSQALKPSLYGLCLRTIMSDPKLAASFKQETADVDLPYVSSVNRLLP